MGKRKASAKPVMTQASAASIMPKPTLIGVQQPAQHAQKSATAEASEAKPGPAPKHEPTLLGLPKHLPTALPPLKPSKGLPQGRESSLVGLSRQVVRSTRPQHKTGIRLKAPAPPPPSAGSHASRRHAAEPTDYNVEIIDAYATPPLPARGSAEAGSQDGDWDNDVQLVPQGLRRNTVLVATAVAILGCAALAVYAFSGQATDAKPHALKAPTPQPSQLTTPTIAIEAVEPVNVDSAAAAAVRAAPAGALSAEQIAGTPRPEAQPTPRSTKPAKLSPKARLRMRAQARRARMASGPARR